MLGYSAREETEKQRRIFLFKDRVLPGLRSSGGPKRSPMILRACEGEREQRVSTLFARDSTFDRTLGN